MGHRVTGRHTTLVAGGVGIAAVALSFGHRDFVLTWIGVLGGPVTGWLTAAFTGVIVGALPLLAISTMVCAVPILLFLQRRRRGWLGASCLLWLGVGYLFTIGLWV